MLFICMSLLTQMMSELRKTEEDVLNISVNYTTIPLGKDDFTVKSEKFL